MKINREEYFDTLDYINEVNVKKFEDLDLSDFFGEITKKKKKEIRDSFKQLNNYNIIYLLISQKTLRDQLKIKLSGEDITTNK